EMDCLKPRGSDVLSQRKRAYRTSNKKDSTGPSHNNRKKYPLKKDNFMVLVLKSVLRGAYFGIKKIVKKYKTIKVKYQVPKFGQDVVKLGALWLARGLHFGEGCANWAGSLWQKIAVSAKQIRSIRFLNFSDAKEKIGRWLKSAANHAAAFNKVHNHVFIPALIAMVAISVSAYVYTNYTLGLNVYLDSFPIASVQEQKEFENILLDFEQGISKQIGEPFKTNFTFYYEFGLIKKGAAVDNDKLYEHLLPQLTTIKELSVLKVDGVIIGANEDKKGIESLLNNIKEPYQKDTSISYVEFDKPVEIETRLCKIDEYKSLDEIKQALVKPKEQQITYTVQQGDTLSAIAPRYGMTTTALLNLNSDVNPEKIKPGDSVLLSREVPMLSVKSIKKVQYTEPIAYDTENVSDPSLYKNQKKVKVQGVEGSQQVSAEIVMMDGVEIETRILDTQVLEVPVTKVVMVGSKALPATAPTGSFQRPTNGIITSPFGYRGREFHTGIDIANAKGTTIHAADGGTVIFAGWKGSYGYCIIIDHGNGIQTLYGHNSKLYVKAGQKVAKGADIAAMGSTGRSTGPHCHFEVRIGGVAKNPRNYVNI
ncbi:MAG: LysM peptidoglycan-binding domain-containing protein, partial [Synergistales bacterium]|nr:LysM peptidoglycan-binding domain-containing protein [Synergistales bacterium]